MMRRLAVLTALAAVLVCLPSRPLAAQTGGTITGRVTDSRTGGAMATIEVSIPGTRSFALTDASGRYVLRGVAAGSQTVRFTWLGYASREATVTLGEGGAAALDMTLETQPIALGEILVTTASRQPERVLESPAAVVSVSPARIRDMAATGQTPLLLADLPGVHVMQSGVNSFNVNVRGFNALLGRRLLVLVDGRDVSAPIVGTQEWPDLSVADGATRVELVKGPNSALYGANAFSGVLNLLTPSIRQDPGTRMTLTVGDPTSYAVQGRASGVSDDLLWGYSVSGGYSSSQSWDRSRTNLGDLDAEYAGIDGDGAAPNPGFEALPLAGQTKNTPFGVPGAATGDFKPLTVARGAARIERYLSNGGVITAEGGTTRLENQVNPSGASRAQVQSSDRPWARLAWTQADLSVMAYYTARSGKQTDLSGGGLFEDWSTRMHLEAQTSRGFAGERGRYVVGGSVRRETVDSKGTVLAPRHDGRSDEFVAGFAQVDFELAPTLKLILAGRLDDASLFDATFAPKAGLVWTPQEDHAVRLTYGRAYLMPSAAQRFVEFPLGPPLDMTALEQGLRASPLGPALLGVPQGTLLGNSAAVPLLALGNEALGPEQVVSTEVGYKGQFEKVFLTADLHVSEFDDFWTDILPGVHPDFGPWTAPATVPEVVRAAVEDAVRGTLPGVTNLSDGRAALVFASTGAGQATQWGVDLSAGVELDEAWRLDGNYSYLDVSFEDGSYIGGDSIAANTPSHSGGAAVTYTSADEASVRLGVTAFGAFRFRNGVWNGDVPSRQSVDLSVGYPLGDRFRAGVTVTNLLDQQRYQYFGGSVIGRRMVASFSWEP